MKTFIRHATISMLLFTRLVMAGELHQAAKKGDLKILKQILAENPIQINCQDETGYTALHWALIRAQWETAEYLINLGADLNIQGGEGGSPLHCAANHDNISIINTMLEKGARLEVKNFWGNTPFCLAVERGCLETVKFLITKGANLNSQSKEGWTPLHYAFMSGHKEIRKILIDAGADQLQKDSQGKLPSDYNFVRPVEMEMNKNTFEQYTGDYHLGGDSYATIFISDGNLWLEEYAIDELYPIATDQFYDKNEPWKIRFFKNREGVVDKIALDFQRQTVVGKKTKNRVEKIEKHKLGIKLESLQREKISSDLVAKLFFDLKLNSNIQLVTYIQQNSAADKAGLKVNDIIFEFYNTLLLRQGDLQLVLYDTPSNVEIPIKIIRNGNVEVLYIVFNDL